MIFPNLWVSVERTEVILDVTPQFTVRLTAPDPDRLRRAIRGALSDALTDEDIDERDRQRALAAVRDRFRRSV